MLDEEQRGDAAPVRAIALWGDDGARVGCAAEALARRGSRLAILHGRGELGEAGAVAARCARAGSVALPLVCGGAKDFAQALDRVGEDFGRLDGVVLVWADGEGGALAEVVGAAVARLRRARPLGRIVVWGGDSEDACRRLVGRSLDACGVELPSRVRVVGVVSARGVAQAFEQALPGGEVLPA